MLGGFFPNLLLHAAVGAYDLAIFFRAEFCGEPGLAKKIESSFWSIPTSSKAP